MGIVMEDSVGQRPLSGMMGSANMCEKQAKVLWRSARLGGMKECYRMSNASAMRSNTSSECVCSDVVFCDRKHAGQVDQIMTTIFHHYPHLLLALPPPEDLNG
jgi:hypothetical protein